MKTSWSADHARPGGVVKRATCDRCLRPQSTCICQWVTPTAHLAQVLILQHPLEVAHAKGSARLLHLSLPHSGLVTGEVFDMSACLASMDGQDANTGIKTYPRQNLLLYPGAETGELCGMPSTAAWPSGLNLNRLPAPSHLRLIVLDGTWRKSRKMLYLNPFLQQLPRLSLTPLQASRYLIRQAHRPGQLSTLEATCAALAQLEGDTGKFEPLLNAFDGFVAQQSGYRPVPHHQAAPLALRGPGRAAARDQYASSD